MQFLTSLLGDSGTTILTSIFALGAVLVLIVLGLWVLKFFMRSTTIARGRGRRLGIVDQLQVDAKRQLLIIRRDNAEHRILTGGPQDVLVETGIPVEKTTLPVRRPLGAAAEEAASVPAEETTPPLALRPHIERLKEFARPAAAVVRKSTSLRHTGLLRPVSVMEPAVIPMPPMTGDNSGRGKADSATTPAGMDGNGRTGFGPQRTFGDTGTGDI